MKDQILAILEEIRPEYDFKKPNIDFISEGMLDSFDVVSLVDALDESFGISIAGADILPENFASVEAIETLVSRSKPKKQ